MTQEWVAEHRGTKRDVARGADFYRIGPAIDVADTECDCPRIKSEWRANQIVNDVNATIEALATKDAEIERLREALKKIVGNGDATGCNPHLMVNIAYAALHPIPDPAGGMPVEVK